jgi:hypothetical protein
LNVKQQIEAISPTLALPLSICQGFFIFFINFCKKQKFNNRDKNHFVFEQKGG